jgi:hypothetical protein
MAKYFYILSYLLFFSFLELFSQCLTAPPAPTTTALTSLPANGDRVDFGETKWFSSSSAQTISSLILNGGTLVISNGDLTINSFQIDSGNIFVNSGATLTILGSPSGSGSIQLKGNIGIYNRGTLHFKNILSFENTYATAAKPIVMINANSNSRLTIDNNWFIINTPHGKLVNNGYLSTHGIIIDALAKPNCVCLSNSITEMTELHNKIPNSYTVDPGQSACIWVKNRSFPSDSLTASPNIKVALNNGHMTYTTKLHPWGEAEVMNNAPSCLSVFTVLPMYFKKFQITQKLKTNFLYWEIDQIVATDNQFTIEKSIDGKQFKAFGIIQANGNTNQFSIEDPTPFQKTFYRIKMSNTTKGASQYSSVQFATYELQENISVYPNPVSTTINLQLPYEVKGEVIIMLKDLQGRIIKQIMPHDNNALAIHCPSTMQPGIYIIQVFNNNRTFTNKIMKH